MAAIFLSHASADDALASDLEAWLRANGFTDLYLDHATTAPGTKWAEALRVAAGACRVIILLVTPSWLASRHCTAEFMAGWYMGKRILPLFLIDDPAALPPASRDELGRVRAEDQGLDIRFLLAADGRLDFNREETLGESLRGGLRAAGALAGVGLDPQAFEIDRIARPTPFPGLIAFRDDDADAAVFFGRSREIAEVLEILRAMRATNDRRPLAILGASGAGKSSLLMAGVIPRLRREAPAWIPLRAFRPGADPLLNFAEAVGRTLEDFRSSEAHGAMAAGLAQAWREAARDEAGALTARGRGELAAALGVWAERLRGASGRPAATVLVSIDQAEEIARAEGESAEALADYLRAAVDAPGPWRLIFAIRADSFPELQTAPAFAGLEMRGHDLRALPVFRFSDVIETPARRYGVAIAPALVDALMADAPAADALPLLAFALQRLWARFSAGGTLTESDYSAMGGLVGIIEDAAERALAGFGPERSDDALPAGGPARDRVDLGAAVFVPALADINDEGGVVRRVADWSGFDAAARGLLETFGRWRLVVRRAGQVDGGTVEVAHEALFREWSRLAHWLEPERARLEAVRGLSVAAAAWNRNGRRPAYATHAGPRLRTARALESEPRYGRRLGEIERDYIVACRRVTRGRTGRAMLFVASVPLIGVALFAGLVAFQAARVALLEARARPLYAPWVHDGAGLRARPGAVFTDCRGQSSDCPEMVVLPAGAFMMGSPATDPNHQQDESPQRPIRVGAFAASRFDITFDNWTACVRGGGCERTPDDNGFGRGRRPVIDVSWDDAKAYAAWMSRMTGKTYRLLSEAEWEYAARGVTSVSAPYSAWSFGSDPARLRDHAWYADNAAGQPHPVGGKPPNAFGLYDMHGNVWQWVEDCSFSYGLAQRDATPVKANSGKCQSRVLRGGSWVSTPGFCRSATRYGSVPSFRFIYSGFRLARTL